MNSEIVDGLWIRSRWYVGIDIGQAHDPTAVCVLDSKYADIPPMTFAHAVPGVKARARQYSAPHVVKHLERLPLGMPYPDQVAYVAGLIARPPLQEPSIYVDYTGVGRPVFELFERARIQRLYGISITGGNEIQRKPHGWNVPKQVLMSRLQALLHTKQLKFTPGIKDGPVLTRELQNFRATYTSAGNAIFNAREGAHDDLVLAVAMAVFGATQPRPPNMDDLQIRWGR